MLDENYYPIIRVIDDFEFCEQLVEEPIRLLKRYFYHPDGTEREIGEPVSEELVDQRNDTQITASFALERVQKIVQMIKSELINVYVRRGFFWRLSKHKRREISVIKEVYDIHLGSVYRCSTNEHSDFAIILQCCINIQRHSKKAQELLESLVQEYKYQ